MARGFRLRRVLRRSALAVLGIATCWLASQTIGPIRADEPAPDAVGLIAGDAISVHGPMNIEVAGGQVKTLLRSGSDVRVNSGQARIELVEGGQIDICGPAHFSVLKSGGSLTLAVDSGIVHLHLGREPSVIVYTPQLQAQPLLIGDTPADLLIGFDPAGAMCVRAGAGAVRLENQLSGQSVVVPQGSDVTVNNGRLENLPATAGHCVCEFTLAKSTPPAPLPSDKSATPPAQKQERTEKSVTPDSAQGSASPSVPAGDGPVYQIFMPPLKFDASAKKPQPIDPNLIVLIRKVRVRPTLIFQGRVEPEAPVVASATPPQPTEAPDAPLPKTPVPRQTDDSVFERVRSFFRRLWSRS